VVGSGTVQIVRPSPSQLTIGGVQTGSDDGRVMMLM